MGILFILGIAESLLYLLEEDNPHLHVLLQQQLNGLKSLLTSQASEGKCPPY